MGSARIYSNLRRDIKIARLCPVVLSSRAIEIRETAIRTQNVKLATIRSIVSPRFPAVQYYIVCMYVHAYYGSGARCEKVYASYVVQTSRAVCDITRFLARSTEWLSNYAKRCRIAERRRRRGSRLDIGEFPVVLRVRARWLAANRARDASVLVLSYNISRVLLGARLIWRCRSYLVPRSDFVPSSPVIRAPRRRGKVVVAMPLLRKQPFQRLYVSSDFRDDDEVYHCEVTNEIFKNYK